MKEFNVGDVGKGMCYCCQKIVDINYKIGSLEYDDVNIDDLILGYCYVCDNIVSVPHQNQNKIRNVLFLKENKSFNIFEFTEQIKGIISASKEIHPKYGLELIEKFIDKTLKNFNDKLDLQ
jgi:hypothetical protein